MSKVVDDIVFQVKAAPDLFHAVDEDTIKSSLIELRAFNAMLLPIVTLKVKDVEIRLTYWDKVRLFNLVAWWFGQTRLNHLTK